MSLINQMLQELDARRSDATGTGSFGQQVRAVYEHNRMQSKVWVALAVGLALLGTGAGAWFWLRPSVPAPIPATAPVTPAAQAPATANLPLKFDTGLNIVQGGVVGSPQTNPEPAQTNATAQAESKPVEPVPQPIVQAGAADKKAMPAPATRQEPAPMPAASASGAGAKSGSAKQQPPEKPPKNAATELPDVAKAALSSRSAPSASGSKAADQASAAAINKQVKELTPQQRAENEYRKGLTSLQQGKASEAVASLEQALELDPMHAAARQTLIGILLEKQHKDAAVRRAREGLTLDAAQPGLAMILARLQLEKGELQPAIDTLERTLPYAVDRADYQAFLAALLQRAERHKEAVEHYFVALQKAPQNGVWWMGAGISLQADRRKPEAAEAFRRAKASGNLSPALVEFIDAQLAQLQQR